MGPSAKSWHRHNFFLFFFSLLFFSNRSVRMSSMCTRRRAHMVAGGPPPRRGSRPCSAAPHCRERETTTAAASWHGAAAEGHAYCQRRMADFDEEEAELAAAIAMSIEEAQAPPHRRTAVPAVIADDEAALAESTEAGGGEDALPSTFFCFSYASAAAHRVAEAKAALEARGHRVFWGKDIRAAADEDWRKQWCMVCDEADVCVNFLSAAYVSSGSCAEEWGYSKGTKSAARIINVLVGGRDAREELVAVPPASVADKGGMAIRLHFMTGGQVARVISDCHFAVQLSHFIPCFLSYSVAFSLK